MFTEDVYTVEEVAKHLRVPVEAVLAEIASGRLHATHVAEYLRIRESDLNAFKSIARTSAEAAGASTTQADSSTALDAVPNFYYTWPDGKKEHFLDAHEGAVSYLGASYRVKIGFTTRDSAGKKRRRLLVLINRYPSVEFVSGDANGSGLMGSVIRDRSGRLLPVGAAPPPEYAGVRIGAYRDVVVGPGAPNGLAVICDPGDIGTMVRHGLIRYRYREERSQNRSAGKAKQQ